VLAVRQRPISRIAIFELSVLVESLPPTLLRRESPNLV
jgi:hypothetical protein